MFENKKWWATRKWMLEKTTPRFLAWQQTCPVLASQNPDAAHLWPRSNSPLRHRSKAKLAYSLPKSLTRSLISLDWRSDYKQQSTRIRLDLELSIYWVTFCLLWFQFSIVDERVLGIYTPIQPSRNQTSKLVPSENMGNSFTYDQVNSLGIPSWKNEMIHRV